MYMNKFWGHFSTINHHKWNVTHLCFRCGLYKQGLLHDLSKYSIVEFWSGVKYHQGYRSPIDAEKEDKGYSLGWLHHKGRNKHHWEYWLDNVNGAIEPIEMPVNFVVEMICDRIAASMIYMKDSYTDASALNYFMNGYDYVIMHQSTKDLTQHILEYLRDFGLDNTTTYIRTKIFKK